MTAPGASNRPVNNLGGSREIVGVDELLDAARQELIRLEPTEALRAVTCPHHLQRGLFIEPRRGNTAALGRDATDVIGGFQKWRQSGLPVAH